MSTIQARLIVGPSEITKHYTRQLIKKSLCKEQGCGTCWACQAVDENRHHSLLWVMPEKNYTRELLVPVFQRLSFARDPEHPFFIVLESADYLTASVGNSLLKSLEEPSAGYYFLLLAEIKDQVMPTVASRCVIEEIKGEHSKQEYANFITLLTTQAHAPAFTQFQKELAVVAKSERAAREITDQVYRFWAEKVALNIQDGDVQAAEYAQKICHILEDHLRVLPMPGSSKTFFRNLYMRLCCI